MISWWRMRRVRKLHEKMGRQKIFTDELIETLPKVDHPQMPELDIQLALAEQAKVRMNRAHTAGGSIIARTRAPDLVMRAIIFAAQRRSRQAARDEARLLRVYRDMFGKEYGAP